MKLKFFFFLGLALWGKVEAQTEEKPLTQVDSIWAKVLRWDGDTTTQVYQKRERCASQLVQLFSEQPQTSLGKQAILHSFFIRLRNRDSQRIIRSFEALDLDLASWEAIFPIYIRSVRETYELEGMDRRLQALVAKSPFAQQKILIYHGLGESYYYKSQLDKAKECFQKVIACNITHEFDDRKEIIHSTILLNVIQKLAIGEKAPFFSAVDLEGQTIQLEEGTCYLLDFWASWCGACLEDLPMLQRIYKRYGQRKDFELIGIALDGQLAPLKNYLAQHQIAWSQICDLKKRKSPIVQLYGGFSLPSYFVIDHQGVIRYNYHSRKQGENLEDVLAILFEGK